MAWSVSMFAIHLPVRSVKELPEEFRLGKLGTKAEIHEALRSVFPDADIANENLVFLHRDDFGLEISMDSDDPVTWLGIRIFGSDSALEAIRLLCVHTGWRAFDTSLGDLINFDDDPTRGLRESRAFFKKVIQSGDNPGS